MARSQRSLVSCAMSSGLAIRSHAAGFMFLRRILEGRRTRSLVELLIFLLPEELK